MNTEIDNEYILSFSIESVKLGISLNLTERVIRAIEVSPLPGAPAIVSGVINLGGTSIPIVDFRKRLKLKKKDVIPSDNIIIVKSATITFGFFTDEVLGLKNIKHQAYSTIGEMIPGSNELIEGITIIENEMILIHDVNKFLSLAEVKQLSKVLLET